MFIIWNIIALISKPRFYFYLFIEILLCQFWLFRVFRLFLKLKLGVCKNSIFCYFESNFAVLGVGYQWKVLDYWLEIESRPFLLERVLTKILFKERVILKIWRLIIMIIGLLDKFLPFGIENPFFLFRLYVLLCWTKCISNGYVCPFYWASWVFPLLGYVCDS